MLWIHYEDLHEDLPAAVGLVARFLGIGADDPQLQALAVQQAHIDFMRQHPTSEGGGGRAPAGLPLAARCTAWRRTAWLR